MFPSNYAVLTKDNLYLTVRSQELFKPITEFELELDTTKLFNSTVRISNTLSVDPENPYVVFWTPPAIMFEDSVVYWRSRAIYENGQKSEWNTTSFTLSNNEEGWGQSDFYQFTENGFSGLLLDSLKRTFNFIPVHRNVKLIHTFENGILNPSTFNLGIDNITYYDSKDPVYKVNEFECRKNTLNFVAFNQNDASPKNVLNLDVTDPKVCGKEGVIMSFLESELDDATNGLAAFIDQLLPKDTVLIFNFDQVNYANWSANTKTQLERLGIAQSVWVGKTNLHAVAASAVKDAWIMVVPKFEVPGSKNSELNFTDTYSFNYGEMNSSEISPSTNYQSVTVRLNESLANLSNWRLTKEEGGMSTTLIENAGDVIKEDLTAFDVPLRSNLRFNYQVSDNENQNFKDVLQWRVLHDLLPDGILVPLFDASISDEFIQGEEIKYNFAYVNSGVEIDADSVSINYEFNNYQTDFSYKQQFKIKTPGRNEKTVFTIELNSQELAAVKYNLKVSANMNLDQFAEASFSNNVIELRELLKIQDSFDPQFNVTFDGRIIMDGELVSATPEIELEISDNNPFLELDTANFVLFLDNQTLKWNSPEISSELIEKNQLKVTFRPLNLVSKTYEFKVVEKNNTQNSYDISFLIVKESTITRFYPYPNPFSDRMRFVFTLTGSELPDEIDIRILTISGRLVRQIDQNELGAYHIGNNLSDFYWDGTDQFGNKLANGVYLYKVTIKNKGKTIKLSENLQDRGFKNGIGKIYILR